MFEIGIFSVIILAISYWAVLWTMGRREDVLHGEFVKAEAQPDEPVRAIFPTPAVRPIFPERPTLAPKKISPEPVLIEQPVKAAIAEQPAFRPERLESLLASIKQDLNQLVQK